jgi:hypothetical protein
MFLSTYTTGDAADNDANGTTAACVDVNRTQTE